MIPTQEEDELGVSINVIVFVQEWQEKIRVTVNRKWPRCYGAARPLASIPKHHIEKRYRTQSYHIICILHDVYRTKQPVWHLPGSSYSYNSRS